MATRDQINDAVRLMLATVTDVNVGLCQIPVWPNPDEDPPAGWPGKKYVVLWPLNTTSDGESWDDPEMEQDFFFNATCVGEDPRYTGWMSSKVHSAFMALKPGGGYLHDIPLVGHDVTMRRMDALGTIVPSGEDLFSSADIYTLTICRS